jgi:HEAT repeat protein
MKIHSSLTWQRLAIAVGCLMLLSMIVSGADQANDQSFFNRVAKFEQLTDQERVAALENNDGSLYQLNKMLISKLGSTNKDVRFYAAYFLGVYRFPEAAKTLAQCISLEDRVRTSSDGFHFWVWIRYPAMEALMKIGSPAISPLIQNLEESDDATVRKLSLFVLCFIDGDKDIVQLRLQIALKSEKDPKKQARIQAAIKSLPESQSPYK